MNQGKKGGMKTMVSEKAKKKKEEMEKALLKEQARLDKNAKERQRKERLKIQAKATQEALEKGKRQQAKGKAGVHGFVFFFGILFYTKL